MGSVVEVWSGESKSKVFGDRAWTGPIFRALETLTHTQAHTHALFPLHFCDYLSLQGEKQTTCEWASVTNSTEGFTTTTLGMETTLLSKMSLSKGTLHFKNQVCQLFSDLKVVLYQDESTFHAIGGVDPATRLDPNEWKTSALQIWMLHGAYLFHSMACYVNAYQQKTNF